MNLLYFISYLTKLLMFLKFNTYLLKLTEFNLFNVFSCVDLICPKQKDEKLLHHLHIIIIMDSCTAWGIYSAL